MVKLNRDEKQKRRDRFKRRKMALFKHNRQKAGTPRGRKIRLTGDSYFERKRASETVNAIRSLFVINKD